VSWPVPRPGLVIRYAYLWDREVRAGREEGVALAGEDGRTRVYALPITHARPTDEAVEIPRAVKAHLGLDEDRSWIVSTEANVFLWPGPSLRLLPGQGPESAAHGFLPPGLFRTVRDRFLALRHERRARTVPRTG